MGRQSQQKQHLEMLAEGHFSFSTELVKDMVSNGMLPGQCWLLKCPFKMLTVEPVMMSRMLWIKALPPVSCRWTHARAHTCTHTYPVWTLCSPALFVKQVWKKPPLGAHPRPPLWSSSRGSHLLVAPSNPSTLAPFAMDVSKPSDPAVLTGGYFERGMAKPSATCDGH